MVRRSLLVLLIGSLLFGCASPVRKTEPLPPPLPAVKPPVAQPSPPAPPKVPSPLVLLPADRLPDFIDDMDLVSLEQAMAKSLRYYGRTAGQGGLLMGGETVTYREQRETLEALGQILRSGDTEARKRRRIAEEFTVYQATGLDGKGSVLFTGYFEPVLKGARTRKGPYLYPVYRPPGDAVQVQLGKFRETWAHEQIVGRVRDGELIPYYSRSEIDDEGVLAGRGLELAWVDDRIALFFLHVQGSGKIRLDDGGLLQIGYAARNGRPYRSLARMLVDTGRVSPDEISYRAIKRYLRDHPGEVSTVLGYNESFIFFREVREGPVGSLGEVLTAGRSIATDPALFPRGALAFIRLRKPVLNALGEVTDWVPFSRFVLNQDTGSAIKGPGRVDLFCGTGEEAEHVAGSLKERGSLFFLVKRRP